MRRIAISATILVLILGAAWEVYKDRREKNVQAGWHLEQMERGQKLWGLLQDYKKSNGDMPTALHKLVEAGQIEPNELMALQFQESPKAQVSPWGYIPNPGSKEGHILLFAPTWIYPWKGHNGDWVVIRVGGSAEAVGRSKAELFQTLTQQARL